LARKSDRRTDWPELADRFLLFSVGLVGKRDPSLTAASLGTPAYKGAALWKAALTFDARYSAEVNPTYVLCRFPLTAQTRSAGGACTTC